jgi:hypothetical protein
VRRVADPGANVRRVFKVGGPVRGRVRLFLKSYVRYRPTELDRRLAHLAEIGRRIDASLYAGSDLTRYELRVFSQNGEDGVLVEMLNRIGVTNRYFVEFGIQDGTEGNCVLLADVLGWPGLFLEADEADFARLRRKYAGTQVATLREYVTAERINAILTDAAVPAEPDVLSIDIDGNDLYVWDALEGFRPRVVIVEYNSGLEPGEPRVQPHDPAREWDGSGAFGTNLAALDVVAERKGYRLAHSDLAGVNAFYVRDDLWGDLGIDRAPRRDQNYGLTGIRQAPADPPGGWVGVC